MTPHKAHRKTQPRHKLMMLAALIIVIGLAVFWFANRAHAQVGPNPVTPGYQICNTTDPGDTKCSFQPIDASHPLPATFTTGGTITGNASGTTGAVVGTLAAAANVTTSICGFSVDAVGGTAAVGPITVAGIVNGPMTFQLFSLATGAYRERDFSPCLPATGTNVPITVTTTANGTATAVNVNSWGLRQ